MWRTASYPASQTRCRIYYRAYCVAQVTIIAPAKYHDCQRTRTAVADASCLTVKNMTSCGRGLFTKRIPIVPPKRCSVIGRRRLAGRSDRLDVVSTRFDSRIGSRTKSNIRPSVRPVGRSVYTIRSSDRPVEPTGRSDDRNVETPSDNAEFKRDELELYWRTKSLITSQ